MVHPVDDMRGTTPPSVPGLLDALAKDFIEHKCDTKQTIRTILNSRTYQTASEVNATNKLDDKFYSHFYPRPMMGPVFLDLLNQATGTTERFGDFPDRLQGQAVGAAGRFLLLGHVRAQPPRVFSGIRTESGANLSANPAYPQLTVH